MNNSVFTDSKSAVSFLDSLSQKSYTPFFKALFSTCLPMLIYSPIFAQQHRILLRFNGPVPIIMDHVIFCPFS